MTKLTTLTESVSLNTKDLIEKSLEGQENAYKQLLTLAIKSTKKGDWIDMGGKPYLMEHGAGRIALRFGISIHFEKNNQGEPLITREDFEDPEHGKGYVYTVYGKACVGNREIEAIGTASTLDVFLGMENVYENGKKVGTKAVSLHESMQDAKKKAVTNFYNNAVSKIIGIKGLDWDDLAEFGIDKVDKAKVSYGKKPESKKASTPVNVPEIEKGRPYWTSEWKGKTFIWAKVGSHFIDEFLQGLGMKESNKTKGTYGCEMTEEIYQKLDKQFTDVEMNQDGGF